MVIVVAATSFASTAVFDGEVPTTEPVPGNYAGPLRLQILQKFMNDPKSCFLDANTINICLNNPTDTVPGNQYWGHIVSGLVPL
jgi:hypothetical protein